MKFDELVKMTRSVLLEQPNDPQNPEGNEQQGMPPQGMEQPQQAQPPAPEQLPEELKDKPYPSLAKILLRSITKNWSEEDKSLFMNKFSPEEFDNYEDPGVISKSVKFFDRVQEFLDKDEMPEPSDEG
jgi:hypothetical protein